MRGKPRFGEIMAYTKIPNTAIKGAIGLYGRNSTEHNTILLVAEARLPYDCISELLGIPVADIKNDLTGETPLDDNAHAVLHNCLGAIIPLGTERGVLPCKDQALTTEILRLLVELLGLQRKITDLQTEKTTP